MVTGYTSTGGGLNVGATIGNAVDFAGSAGTDTVSLGATTKDITMGDGDDTVTITSALGTGGSVAGGNGNDTLVMLSSVAASVDGNATFNTGVSGFETVRLTTAVAAGTTIDFAALNAPTTVVMDLQGAHLSSAIVNNLADNSTVEVKASGTGSTINISGASAATNDTLNIKLSNVTAAADAFDQMTVASVENINLDMNDTGAGANVAATIDTLTLVSAAATTIAVSGNNGLNLTNTDTTITSFTSTVAGNDAITVDTAANTGITWTTGALAGASTIITGAGNDTINAAAAVKAVSITSNAGIDAITGSATFANILNAGAQNDSIVGGAAADTVTGGTGTDTFTVSSTTLLEQAGASTTLGHMVNLGSTAISAASIFTLTADYLAGAQTELAANTGSFLFNGESNTNASVIDTFSGIENLVGGSGTDYLIGSATANTFTGGAADNFITTGGGADTVILTVEAAIDVVTDFTGGAGGDIIQIDVSAYNTNNLSDSTGTKLVDATAAGFINYTVGATSAANAVGSNIIFVTNTTGINAIGDVNTALGNNVITMDAGGTAFANGEGSVLVFYDANGGFASIGYLEDNISGTAGAFDGTGSTHVEYANLTMTAAQYATLTADNFDFI